MSIRNYYLTLKNFVLQTNWTYRIWKSCAHSTVVKILSEEKLLPMEASVLVVGDIGVGWGVVWGNPYHTLYVSEGLDWNKKFKKNPIRGVGTSDPSGQTPAPLLGQCPNFCSFYLLKASLSNIT